MRSELYFLSGVISGVIFSYACKKFTEEKDEYYFLCDDNIKCQACFMKNIAQTCKLDMCSYGLLMKILKILGKAKQSIDVCSPCIEIGLLAEALIKAMTRGVTVRIITGSIDEPPRATIHCMAVGIRVKGLDPPNFMMHNKFIVVDKKILIRSSLNWTFKSFQGNFENLQIIKRQENVDWYQVYFHKMWQGDHRKHTRKA